MALGYTRFIREINLLGDLILLNGAFLALFYFKVQPPIDLTQSVYFELLMMFNISWIFSSFIARAYDKSRTIRLEKLTKKLINTFGLYFLFVLAFVALRGANDFLPFNVQAYSLIVLVIGSFHMGMYLFLKYYRRIGYNYKKVLIIGYGELAHELSDFFARHPEHGYKFFGFFDDNQKDLVKGSLDEVPEFALDNKIEEIYCCLPYTNPERVQELIDFAEDNFITFKIIPDFRGFSSKNLEIQQFEYIPVLKLRPKPLDHYPNQLLKRCFDVVFTSLVFLFVFSWLFPLLALWIKMDSKGPVFFKQLRHGKGNDQFLCYKFRTMVVNDEADHKQATKNDPRITKIGAFLRKTSLDEFPQFINVLKGDMSVVGPRPHPIKLNEFYFPVIDKFVLRHSVKPGVTGLAQAKGYRGETQEVQTMKNRVRMDKFYIENWSLALDIKIIILTVFTIFQGDDNAY